MPIDLSQIPDGTVIPPSGSSSMPFSANGPADLSKIPDGTVIPPAGAARPFGSDASSPAPLNAADALRQQIESDPNFPITREHAKLLYEDQKNKSFGDKAAEFATGAKEGAIGLGKQFVAAHNELKDIPFFDKNFGHNAERVGNTLLQSGAVGMQNTAGLAKRAGLNLWDWAKETFTGASDDQRIDNYLKELQLKQGIAKQAAAMKSPGFEQKQFGDAPPFDQAAQATSLFTDPSFLVGAGALGALKGPLAAGMKAVPGGARALELAQAAKALPGKAATGALGGVEKAGAKVANLAERPVTWASEKLEGILPEGGSHAADVAGMGALALETGGKHLLKPVALLKGAQLAGKVIEETSGFFRRLAEANGDSVVTRLQQIAADASAPKWMQISAGKLDALGVSQGARFLGDLGEAGLHGAGIGAGLSAAAGDNAQEVGQGAGAGFGLGAAGGGFRGLSGANTAARRIAAIIGAKQRFSEYVMGKPDPLNPNASGLGLTPDQASQIGDYTETIAGQARDVFGSKLKFQFVPPDPTAPPAWFKDGTIFIELGDRSGRINHELPHAILRAVGADGQTRLTLDNIFKPDQIFDFARQYAEKMTRSTDPATVAQYIADETKKAGGDKWIYDELYAEAGYGTLEDRMQRKGAGGFQDLLGVNRTLWDKVGDIARGDLLNTVGGFFSPDGNSFDSDGKPTVPPGAIFSDPQVYNNPALRKLFTEHIRQVAKGAGTFAPKTDETPSAIVPQSQLGKSAAAPAAMLQQTGIAAPKPNGEWVPTPALARQRQRAMQKGVGEEVAKLPSKAKGDTSPEVAPRVSATGEQVTSGSKIVDMLNRIPAFGDWAKAVAAKAESLMGTGDAFRAWYFPVHDAGKLARGGDLAAKQIDLAPFQFAVDSKNHVLIFGLSISAAERKMQRWQSEHRLDDLWNGDADHFRADLMTYLKNHAEGRPGAAGLDEGGTSNAEAKRNALNLFVVGKQAKLADLNPLRAAAGGKEREGIIRSLRLDRITTTEDSPHSGWQAEYEKKKINASPSVDEGAQFSPRVEGQAEPPQAPEEERRGMFPANVPMLQEAPLSPEERQQLDAFAAKVKAGQSLTPEEGAQFGQLWPRQAASVSGEALSTDARQAAAVRANEQGLWKDWAETLHGERKALKAPPMAAERLEGFRQEWENYRANLEQNFGEDSTLWPKNFALREADLRQQYEAAQILAGKKPVQEPLPGLEGAGQKSKAKGPAPGLEPAQPRWEPDDATGVQSFYPYNGGTDLETARRFSKYKNVAVRARNVILALLGDEAQKTGHPLNRESFFRALGRSSTAPFYRGMVERAASLLFSNELEFNNLLDQQKYPSEVVDAARDARSALPIISRDAPLSEFLRKLSSGFQRDHRFELVANASEGPVIRDGDTGYIYKITFPSFFQSGIENAPGGRELQNARASTLFDIINRYDRQNQLQGTLPIELHGLVKAAHPFDDIQTFLVLKMPAMEREATMAEARKWVRENGVGGQKTKLDPSGLIRFKDVGKNQPLGKDFYGNHYQLFDMREGIKRSMWSGRVKKTGKFPNLMVDSEGRVLATDTAPYPIDKDVSDKVPALEPFAPENPDKIAYSPRVHGQAEFGETDEPRAAILKTRKGLLQLAQANPEAVRPRLIPATSRVQKVGYDIANSPLVRTEGKESAISILANKAAKEIKANLDRPEITEAQTWYPKVREGLRRVFGANADTLSQLLAATSARTNVRDNFKIAVEALRLYSEGKYDGLLKRYTQFVDANGADKGWTEMPLKENGQKFNANSRQVLRVLASVWADKAGLKTKQFYQNLAGLDPGATIDVWAARTMRRLSYDDGKTRWRILPVSEKAVSPKDFRFSQQVMAEAGKKLGLNPEAAQSLLWFIEKDHWENNGWTRGAGAEKSSFGDELAKFSGETLPGELPGLDLSGNQSTRVIAGVTTWKGGKAGQGIFMKELAGLRNFLRTVPGVTAAHVSPTHGLWFEKGEASKEPSFNVEATMPKGASVEKFTKYVEDLGHRAGQSAVFVSQLVDASHPNARPQYEAYFRRPLPMDQAKQVMKAFIDEGIQGYTLATDAKGRYIGFRTQYIPEFAGHEFTEGAKREALKSQWEAQVKRALANIDTEVKNSIVFSKVYHYDTKVIFGK